LFSSSLLLQQALAVKSRLRSVFVIPILVATSFVAIRKTADSAPETARSVQKVTNDRKWEMIALAAHP